MGSLYLLNIPGKDTAVPFKSAWNCYMISEESYDTEDWSKEAEKTNRSNVLHFKF